MYFRCPHPPEKFASLKFSSAFFKLVIFSRILLSFTHARTYSGCHNQPATCLIYFSLISLHCTRCMSSVLFPLPLPTSSHPSTLCTPSLSLFFRGFFFLRFRERAVYNQISSYHQSRSLQPLSVPALLI